MMGETGVPVENHRPATSKDTLYYIKCYRVHLTTGRHSSQNENLNLLLRIKFLDLFLYSCK